MKKIIFVLFAFIGFAASAQNYADSLITIKGTQRLAWWITKSIQLNADTRKLPDVLKNFVGSGTRPDSVYTVTLKAGLLRDGMELLFSRPLLLSLPDYNSLILGQPAVSGFSNLGTQLTAIANNGAQRNTAQWLLSWYNGRVNDYSNLYTEEKNAVIKLVQ
jgi:hypothetical protein